jgi:signal transduction histidine kinase
MNKNLGTLVLVILAFSMTGRAQDSVIVDSLNSSIPTLQTDYNINTVFDILEKKFETMPRDQAFRAANLSLERARESGNRLSIIFAIRNLGKLYSNHGNKEDALKYFQQAVEISKEEKKGSFGQAVALLHFGLFMTDQGLLSEGLQSLLEASKYFEDMSMLSYVILCHYEAMLVHFSAKNYHQGMEEGYRVLAFQDKLPSADVNYSVDFQRMSTYNTIGLCNRELGQYDMAIINYDKALQLGKKIENEFWLGLINGNKAVVLKQMGRTDDALASLLADYRTSVKFKVWSSAGIACITISDIYLEKKNVKVAGLYLDSARMMFARESDKYASRRAASHLYKEDAKYYSAIKKYPEAYTALWKHVELRDSLSYEQESLSMAKAKASYDLDRKQTEIELLTKNNEIQQERIRSQKTLFIATLVVLILVILLSVNLIYNFRRQKNIYHLLRTQRDEIEAKNAALELQGAKLQENNQYIQSLNAKLEQKVATRTSELEETNKELDTFLYHSSHDIRRPITTLLGLDHIARQISKEPEVISLFDKVAETARSMDNMLFKMQMVYELNKPDHPLELTDVSEIISSVTSLFKTEFDRTDMTNHLTLVDNLKIFSNRILLSIVLRNLIENAILFRKTHTDAQPFVDIIVQKTNATTVEIAITDNGIGIEEKYQHQVFELYFRGSPASRGNGLGLYLVRKAVGKLNGTISLMSDYGMGSTFTIVLPIVQ